RIASAALPGSRDIVRKRPGSTFTESGASRGSRAGGSMPSAFATAGGSQPGSPASGATEKPFANSIARPWPPISGPRSSSSRRRPARASMVAATRPFAPPPTTIVSKPRVLMASAASRWLRARSRRRSQDPECREPARAAHDPAAGVRSRAALPVAADRRAVLRPTRHRPQEEELLQCQLALEDVALGEARDALDVGRRQHLAVQDQRLDVGRVAAQGLHHGVAERLALLVGPA